MWLAHPSGMALARSSPCVGYCASAVGTQGSGVEPSLQVPKPKALSLISKTWSLATEGKGRADRNVTDFQFRGQKESTVA